MRFRNLKKQSKKSSQTKNKSSSAIKYAKTVDKIKAFITDMFMIYAPILYIITYGVMGGKEEFQSSNLAPLVGVLLYALIDALLTAKFGETPGKKAYAMRVVDETTHENISFFRALFRFFIFMLSATSFLGLFVGFFRKDKKTLQDIICNTVIIEVENKDI